ncbi:MAG: aminotransferase class IV [Myxococcota bacterium]
MTETGLVLIDGEPCALETARVSVFDRGFLYGDSVFEALRTYAGKPFGLGEHMARLMRSARLVGITPPLSQEAFEREVARGIELAGLPECYVRVLLTRGRADKLGLSTALAGGPLRVIFVLPLELPSASKYETGIAAVTYRTQRLADGTSAAGAKLGNYLVSVLAIEQARSAGAEEAVMVDHRGKVLEGATSNLFLVSNGRLMTPPLSEDILAGITRHHVIELAKELGLAVEERTISSEELAAGDELFLSSSIRELLPIVKLDGATIGSGRPGPVYNKLLVAFRERARTLAVAEAAAR